MLARLTLSVALIAALGGCASTDSRYYREDVVYADGSYYAPAADGEGDYYYAPDDEDRGYADGYYDFDYGYGWSDWRFGAPYPPYYFGPDVGRTGFYGYCALGYYPCLPWWAGSYRDPRYRFWIGLGWDAGWPRNRRHDHDGDRDRDRDHDRWRGDRDHDRPEPRPRPTPPPAPETRPSIPPDMSRPAPTERMPRPVFEGKFGDRRLEPPPSEERPRPMSSSPTSPLPANAEETPDPSRRWRERRTMPMPPMPAPADSGVRLRPPPQGDDAPRPTRPPARREPLPDMAPPAPRGAPPPARREGERGNELPGKHRAGRDKAEDPPG